MIKFKIPEPDASFSLIFIGNIFLVLAVIGTLMSMIFTWFNLFFIFAILFFYLGWKNKKSIKSYILNIFLTMAIIIIMIVAINH